MNGFDFADIERVNRIELKPGEMIVFRAPRLLDLSERAAFHKAFQGTPLEGRTLLIGEPGWELDTVDQEDSP